MDSKTKKAIKKKFEAVGMKPEVAKYFLHAITFCDKKKIHALDINLTNVLYPELARKFKKAEGSIEKEMISELSRLWASPKSREALVKELKYTSKPTVKKLLIILSK